MTVGSSVCVGNSAIARGGEQTLIRVDHFLGDMDVYEMVFEPDVPMETYYIDSGALLTEGKRAAPRNRGYIRKDRV